MRLRLLPRPLQPWTSPDQLRDLEATGYLARAAGAEVYRRRSPAPQPGPHLQRRRQIQTEHRSHGDRGAGAGHHYEAL